MKILHTSDLHIGKRVNEFSMIEDQEYILKQMLSIIEKEKPQGLVIAGDVYDKSIPSVEGVTLFDWFLTELHNRDIVVFMVSGNHDSCERIHFAGRIMKNNQIHIAGTFQGKIEKIEWMDQFGPVNLYLMPFLKPAIVNRFYPGVETYQQAIETVIAHSEIDPSQRNILVAHQFITSGNQLPEQSESESISLGGLDNIDASVFDCFDYVALGHIHKPQRIGRDTIRYSGSPLKYSFSEVNHIKSVTLIECREKGDLEYRKIPLKPLRDMRKIKGPIAALLDQGNYSKANTLDYIHATLTDEEELYDAIGQLRSIYPNIMKLEFENSKSLWNSDVKLVATEVEQKNPLDLFEEFYESQNNVPMTELQKEIMGKIFEEVAGDKK